MNYLQITMETALLTTQFRLRSIDSESQSLSSERTWKPDDPKLTGTQATTTSRATVLAPWHKTGGHSGFLSPLAKIQLSFLLKFTRREHGHAGPTGAAGRGPRQKLPSTTWPSHIDHWPTGGWATPPHPPGQQDLLRDYGPGRSSGRTKLELLPCCQSKMSSTNQELSPCCQSNMSWAKRLLYVFIYHC